METDRNQEPAASPKKRGAAEEERISLDAIREVVRGEIGVSTATLLTEIGARMDRVETGVTAQLERTLERLQTITAQQRDQQQTVEAIQGNQQRMNARLQTLEAKVQTLQQSGTGSTVDTESGGRKPALQRRDFDEYTYDHGPPSRCRPRPGLCPGGPQRLRHPAVRLQGKTSRPRTCEKDCRGHSVGSNKPTSQWGPTRKGRPATFGCNSRSPRNGADEYNLRGNAKDYA